MNDRYPVRRDSAIQEDRGAVFRRASTPGMVHAGLRYGKPDSQEWTPRVVAITSVYVHNIRYMIDLSSIVGFDWDDGNASKNDKHAVTQSEAEQAFFDLRLLIVGDVRHSMMEPRFHALGQTLQGRRLHVTFTIRSDGTLIRVISARDMHRKERMIYEQEA